MGELRDPRHPRDVLEAVRRLEDDVEALRARAAAREPEDTREVLAELLATDRRETVEDMERLVELVAATWRSTRRELAAITLELAALGDEVRASRASLAGARLEVHLPDEPPGNGSAQAG